LAQRVIERAVSIAMQGGQLALEGIYLPGEGDECMGAVVAPPHPLYGGSMDAPVVNELAYACQKAGHASLRFNWRGVGGSAGTSSGEAQPADEDYSAATLYLEETVAAPLIAAGYSFGAAAAIRACQRHPRFRRLLLVAPPPALFDDHALAGLGRRLLLLTGEHDQYAPPEALAAIVSGIPSATLHVIPEADHFFMKGLSDISRIVQAWL